MPSVKFTMVMDEETARKMDYIAAYNDRSRIKEILRACKDYIKQFERDVDKIQLENNTP